MTSRLGEPSVATAPASGPSPPAAATQGEGGEGDGVVDQDAGGIDEAAFVCLMVKVHYLIICPPVRAGLDPFNVPFMRRLYVLFIRVCAPVVVSPTNRDDILTISGHLLLRSYNISIVTKTFSLF